MELQMRKIVTLATALSMLAFAVPMQASAQTATPPPAKTEAPKAEAAKVPAKAKVATVKKTKHYAKRHHRKQLAKRHRLHHMTASQAREGQQETSSGSQRPQASQARCP
jgi:hypothetical protein